MAFVLVSTEGDRRFLISGSTPLVAGRDLSCDLPVLDARVSRRHAEFMCTNAGVDVIDLESRNGTWLNGARITRAQAHIGDTIGLGSVTFALCDETNVPSMNTLRSGADETGTVVRERIMQSREGAITEVAGQRLGKLVLLAQRLGGSATVDELLTIIVDDLFAAFSADRVAVLLRNAEGALDVRYARDVYGSDVLRTVPRAIAHGVAERQVALLTHDAREDTRTAGASVIQQAVRSAMAAPLLADGHQTLGVLYVDNLRTASAFTEDDLQFLVAFAGIAAAAVERELASEGLRRAQHVRENFERFFTPRLAERIATSTDTMEVGGHRQRVVVLFSDIRGFTAIAESLPPQQMAAQLNEYFTAMVDCVFAHDGALDKFIGDALLAYWGVPEPTDADADRALASAMAMRAALDVLNARWRTEGRPELHAGVAIHAGEAFVGNIGSPRRLEYTLIGDSVNVSNKLCRMARGGELLISESVRALTTQATSAVERTDLSLARQSGSDLRIWSIAP